MYKIAFLAHMDINLYLFRLPIMKKLLMKGWAVYAITPEGRFSSKFLDYGIIHIPYDISRSSFNPITELKTILEICRILRNLRPTLLHTFMAKPNIYGTIAGKIANIPIIINAVTGLGSFYVENNLFAKLVRKLINFFYRIAFFFSDHVIFQNVDDLEYFHKYGLVNKTKATVIKSSGIDTKRFSPIPSQSRVLADLKKKLNLDSKIVILMISRLLKHKGVLEYCRAAQQIKSNYKNKVEFLIVGVFDKGNPFCVDEEDFSYYIKSDIIKFLGFRNDIKELVAICDIYVLPSYREGISRTLLEAASMGKPIITTDVPGCREVVDHGKNGFLIEKKNSDELAEKLEILIGDRSLRIKFGKNSREKAKKEFDQDIVVEQTVKLYEGLLQGNLKKFI